MIEVQGLTRTYGDFTAVNDVTFTCSPGKVTGFLGPNGAGKTTTMRILVGLTNPSSGTATILGRRFQDIPNPGRYVGVLLDAGAQHGGRTGREVLRLSAIAMGLPMSRVDEMLALVALNDEEASRRVRNYSLGMKQRLGIAHALLGDPQVLILDEPANGLDPAGIRWMRGLLKSFADRGGTVLLSSHLLNEVEIIADEMLLIGHGRIVGQGDKASLLAANRDKAPQATATVSSLDDTQLATLLREKGLHVTAGQGLLTVSAQSVEVGRVAAEHGIVLTSLVAQEHALEDVFFDLTSGTQRGPGDTPSAWPGQPPGPPPPTPLPPTPPPPAGPPSSFPPPQPGAPQ